MNFNIDDLKKKIIYRSAYRGTKEMDSLVSSFTNKYIDSFNTNELNDLSDMLDVDDLSLYNFNQNKKKSKKILLNKVTLLFRDYNFEKK
tara:strand:- start:23 stop:289 length:267 start_codon:yes stop_codon:yes gene_type:complete